MEWAPQQSAAIQQVLRWYRDPKAKQVFRLFGYAGSGKTTLAKEIAAQIKGLVLSAAFTGKAALVLRKKGMTGASTLHSLIYKPEEDPISGKTVFSINQDSALATAALLIVDEVSMVDVPLGVDVASFGTKILVLGDPKQLQPIEGEGYFTSQEPDVMLTEIHRQAAENPIIRLSIDAREGRQLRPGNYGPVRVVRRRDISMEEMRSLVMKADQVLCGKNATRQTFNARYRAIKGRSGKVHPTHPVQGDRLVCLRNNAIKGLMNGSLWDMDAMRIKPSSGWLEMRLDSADDENADAEVIVAPQFFLGADALKEMDWRDKKRSDQFDYGYALTVHKAQGSQWDDVLLYDESGVFRDTRMNHLYTGITRAAESLTVVLT